MKIELKNVTCGYGKNTIIKDISMEIKSGEALCILGPNGVGKTTLFKTILGFLKLQKGEILIDGRSIYDYKTKELAKIMGYVPQAHNPPFPFKVIDIVLMGRISYMGAFSSPRKKDMDIALRAMETLDILYLKDRIYTEISGGEKQLTLIARALAQEAKMLIMDEPTSNLDFGHQIRVLNHINDLIKSGIGVIMTSHFPNHVFLCATKVSMIKDGKLFKIGTPKQVITKESLKDIYGIDTEVIDIERKHKRNISYCIPV
ncbi:ABC transporter ATP-binding protein [Maledivibacter halophilus]|uniref:Iron complex transport system ATP-binding protein n=1 Tax=Maledivibacter halophilus TaxID=36842 RepID=A0A1T5J5M9_9FIRM|nr:ABC transporter ATP-binding protein [Maledivibacter halophilus]SKC46720.1 iron complex transport system ATP-binding protein [Maledivibacter halophilus]